MNIRLNPLAVIIIILGCLCANNSYGNDREAEIRTLMWGGANPDFNVTNVPKKWANESAVIIAQLNSFEYKKAVIINEVHFNKNSHYRIKLIDKNAVNKYAEISFSNGDGRKYQVYTGFKVIKPDGKEIIIDPSSAVQMDRKENGKQKSYKKLAIPNLEPGDILDYYISEEKIIQPVSKIYYFKPVLFHLYHQYPVMKQKLQFDVQRRCFISLRSLNEAPELKLEVDEENDRQRYFLEDTDREAVKDLRWFFSYRELPSIKFRAAYASGQALRQNDVLLGEPGVVKSSVSKKELAEFVSFLLVNTYTESKDIMKYVKRNADKQASNFEIAKMAYYYWRNKSLQSDEITTIADKSQWNQYVTSSKDTDFQFVDRFSGFLAASGIPYDIVIVIPRNVSSLDDLLLEHELKYLIRVKQDNEYLYLSPINNFKLPGEINTMLEGADAYVVDGLAKYKNWAPERIKIPVSREDDNATFGLINVAITEGFNAANLKVQNRISGHAKLYYQYWLLDFYDYEDEERSNYEMSESFTGTLWMKKKLLNLKQSYLSNRDNSKNKFLKSVVDEDYDFKTTSVSNLNIEKTGRYESDADMVYGFDMSTEDLISKVGRNYLLDIGKLIKEQVKINDDEMQREYGVYMSSPRSFKYKIVVDIPEGYSVQGLDKLNQNIENVQGGFTSNARIDGNKIVIDTYKHYNSCHASKDEWPLIVEFLNAAYNFTEQKILFKKG